MGCVAAWFPRGNTYYGISEQVFGCCGPLRDGGNSLGGWPQVMTLGDSGQQEMQTVLLMILRILF